MNVPAALERSRSGNGGHVWFFFNEAVPAALARKPGYNTYHEDHGTPPEVGLDSYDRLFPIKTHYRWRLRNLIALLFSGGSRIR